VDNILLQILTKYNRMRQLLAEANLEVAHAVRTIDDVPTRTELIQYERRFVELYQQVRLLHYCIPYSDPFRKALQSIWQMLCNSILGSSGTCN
jgi:hypothetical protein